jgi:autotransporter-associated beta strand protein
VGGAGNGANGAGGVGVAGSNLTINNSGTIAGGLNGDGVTRANAITFTGGSNVLRFMNGTAGLNGNIGLTGALTFDQSGIDATIANVITGSGAVTKSGTAMVTLSGANTYTGGTTINDGTLSISSDANLGNTAGAVTLNGGALQVTGSGVISTTRNIILGVDGGGFDIAANDGVFILSERVTGPGRLSKTGAGWLSLNHVNDYSGGTTVSEGILAVQATGALGTGSVTIDAAGASFATILFGTSASAGTLRISLANANSSLTFADSASAGDATIDNIGTVRFNDDSSAGNARITNSGRLYFESNATADHAVITTAGGRVDISNLASAGIGIGSLSGDGAVYLGARTLTLGGLGTNATIGGIIQDGGGAGGTGGSLIKTGSGTLILTGANSYTGATTVNGGTMIVNGSIASSSGLTVAAGGTLGGSGVLPSTTVHGTLSPGNSPGTLTVSGDLVMGAGSLYLAEIQGAVADRIDVGGTASLAGTLRLVPLGGAYSFNSAYTLLSAAGGLGGTSFSPVDTTGTFGDGVTTAVSYTANDVLLTLTPKPLATLGVQAPRNAYAIATAIDGSVANGGDPSSLFGIYNLPAAAIPAAVNSLSGEIHTAAPAMAHVASDQFLRTMLDPTAAGRLGDAGAAPGTALFSGLVRKGADRPARPERLDVPFYSVWGSAYGSYGRTDGNAAIGSASRSIDDAHLAAGIDVRLMPGTVAGIAVSGGTARASLPGLLGKIDADVLQAGLYGVTQLGRVKLGGALSYARLENDVSRAIPALGSSLSSSYATTAWSGRLQASAALLNWNGFSVSPLAAVQATRARSPAVTEANWAGANAGALALSRRSDVTSRSELGVQLDADSVLGGVPVTGYVRAAWAHYFRRDADLTASLAGLPGASFTATGAEADRNSALLSAGVMAKLSERVSLGLNLDGELSANSNRIGGSAQLRVSF